MKKLFVIMILFVAAIVPVDNIKAGEKTASLAIFSVHTVNNSTVYSVVELFEYITPFTKIMVMHEVVLPGVAPVTFGPFNTGTYDVKVIVNAPGSRYVGFNQFSTTVMGPSSGTAPGTIVTFPNVTITAGAYISVS